MMCHTGHNAARIGPWLLIALALLAPVGESRAQLDETWTVNVGGQSAQVNPDGTFRITNIPIIDSFGGPGPGLSPDGLSDGFMQVTGTGFVNGELKWTFSEFFQAPAGDTYVLTVLDVYDFPLPSVDTMTIDISDALLEIGDQPQITTSGVLSDGTVVDISSRSAWTNYTISNPELAVVDEDGLVTALKNGTVAIGATNGGTSTVKTVRIVDQVMTIIAGFVQLEDGTPTEGVEITLPQFGGSPALTDSTGFFSIPVMVPGATKNLGVRADGIVAGDTLVGFVKGLTPVADGFTDAGIIVLRTPPCEPEWVDGEFCPPGLYGPVPGEILAMTTWDDGTGEALYIGGGGDLTIAGCTNVSYIAKWDGSTWSALGTGITTTGGGTQTQVYDLAVFDDGTGSALYAAGRFVFAGGLVVNNIAKWDGTSWSSLGDGTTGPSPQILALEVFDDGTGPALYAGGYFRFVEGAPINRIAKWDGSSWSPLGTGAEGSGKQVRTLEVFDDGTGEALYMGGNFLVAGGVTVNMIAKWDGSAFSPLDMGVNGGVDTLTVFNDGTGPALFAGGFLIFDSGFSGIAKWDGAAWTRLVDGPNSGVKSLTPFGTSLYAGGTIYDTADGQLVGNIVEWDPAVGFSPLGTGMDSSVNVLATFDDGAGEDLYIGGRFIVADGIAASRMARWDGSAMSRVPDGKGMTDSVQSLVVFDDGNGPALHAGGAFRTAGHIPTDRIAKWDGQSWSQVGTGMSNWVNSMAVFDDGSGPALYAGGTFTEAGGTAAERMARWDGSNWAPLGAGIDFQVITMMPYHNGTGPGLYVAGAFNMAGGQPAKNIARWDGSDWSPLGSGMNGRVFALEVFDDGTGLSLYAGGEFTTANGVAASSIARLCGSTWSPLGSGIDAGVNLSVWSLGVFDDGTGPALFAGGNFSGAGGVAADHIAKWDGSTWAPLDLGVNRIPEAMIVYDDGTGPALYVAGKLWLAGGMSAPGIARWDGLTWSPLGLGLTDSVNTAGSVVTSLAVFDDGSGPALFAGGTFQRAGGLPSTFMAKWQTPVAPCPAP
jgi:hypothetical protein